MRLTPLIVTVVVVVVTPPTVTVTVLWDWDWAWPAGRELEVVECCSTRMELFMMGFFLGFVQE